MSGGSVFSLKSLQAQNSYVFEVKLFVNPKSFFTFPSKSFSYCYWNIDCYLLANSPLFSKVCGNKPH